MISDLLPSVVTGLGSGSIYALAAMGLVLTYKTSGVFNFAHGAQGALGAYIMWDLWARLGWPWPLAAAVAVLLAGVVAGFLIERFALLLADKPPANRIVATIGLLVVIQSVIVLRYGAATIPMRYFLPTRTVEIGGVNIRYEQLVVFALAALAAVWLNRFFRTAKLGVAMQAVVDDPALLGLQGVSPVRVRRQAWIIGSCFAAASGALLAPSLGLDPILLTLLVVQAFGAAAIGRFSGLALTYAGGLIVGVGQELVKYTASQDFFVERVNGFILQPLPSTFPFFVLFVVLLVTHRSKLVERGSRVVRRERPPAAWSPVGRAAVLAAGAVGLLLVPQFVSTRLPVYTTAVAFVVIFVSLHLLVRTSGQVSLCQMTFAAIGAATYAHAMDHGVPYPVAVLLAGLVAVPVGAFIAIPAIRLPGVFLAIATFGFGILVERIFLPTSFLFGARQTLVSPRPSFAEGDKAYYYLVLAVAVAGCALAEAVRRGRLGRLLQALGDQPAALAAHGASTNAIRTFAFCLSAALAGVGGALLGPVTRSATAFSFNFGVSLTLLAVLFVAGRRAVLSAFVAAAAYQVVPSYITSANAPVWTQIAFGVAAIAVTCGIPALIRRALISGPRAQAREAAPVSPARSRLAEVVVS
ncbi:MAG: ABC transporter permease [Actinomycetota bacterium]